MNMIWKSDEGLRDEMLAHLSEKYNGQEFVGLALEKGYSIRLHCYPKDGDPQAENVRMEMKKRDGKWEYRDTYFGIIIREDFENEVLSACSALELPMKAFFNSDTQYYNNIFDGTKTYADFKEWVNNGNPDRFAIAIMVCSDGSDKEEYANRIFDTLEKDGFEGMITVCFYPPEAYEQLTRINRNELARQYSDQYAIFSKNVNRP